MINISTPAEGDDFFDREEDIKHIKELLQNGNNVLLLSPRKFGKSSILRRISLESSEIIYIDLQTVRTFEGFFSYWLYYAGTKGIIKKITEKFSDIKEVLERIEKFSISVEGASVELLPRIKNWQDWTDRLVKELDKIENVVIIFDEFPDMIENFIDNYTKKEVRDFLRWFSGITEKYPKICYIICGSVCLDFVVRELKFPRAFMNFKRYELEMMSSEKAAELFEKKLVEAGLKPTAEATKRMLDIVDPIPWFILLLAYDIYSNRAHLSEQRVKKGDIDRAYRNILGYREFNYYLHRLEKYSREHYDVGKKLLYELSKDECLSSEELWGPYQYVTDGGNEDSFFHLLADLENDFYIKYDEERGGYRFYSKVLRDWWGKLFR
ncbi:MAG: hypothetical protein D6733_01965 [Methanobacteriota archaeon]|nr:MAG: hypothetical protein D6733_01965 [Euryarchaeota archaeon]